MEQTKDKKTEYRFEPLRTDKNIERQHKLDRERQKLEQFLDGIIQDNHFVFDDKWQVI